MTSSSFFHVVNPAEKWRRAVERAWSKPTDRHYQWVRRELHPTHLETILEWAVAEGYRCFAIWGGDGSFSRAVQWFYENNLLKDVVVALVPVGTCNDFARALKLPSWRNWVSAINGSSFAKKNIDVGLLESGSARRIFMNNAGFGRARAAAARQGKSNAVSDALNLKSQLITLDWQSPSGHRFETRPVFMMAVFNAPYFHGGLHFFSNLNAWDGLLSAAVVPPLSKVALLWLLAKGKMGRSLHHKNIERVDTDKLNVHIDEPVIIQADGDMAFRNPIKKVSFAILPALLKMAVPAEEKPYDIN